MPTTPDVQPRGPAGANQPTVVGVDMSPEAIERRLATVGALYALMRSLMTARPSDRRPR